MALRLASNHSQKIFLATAEALDQEMSDRIAHHRLERGNDWITVEEPVFLGKVLKENPTQLILVDCITLWLSNVMMRFEDQSQIETEIDLFCEALQTRAATTILVTNEVGMGIVPENQNARLFRDLAGKTNQRIAAISHRVILMVSGLPINLK